MDISKPWKILWVRDYESALKEFDKVVEEDAGISGDFKKEENPWKNRNDQLVLKILRR